MKNEDLCFCFYKKDASFLDKNSFEKNWPIIQIFKTFGLPEPIRIEFYTKTLRTKIQNIKGWQDLKLIQALQPEKRDKEVYQLYIYFDENTDFFVELKIQYRSEIICCIPKELIVGLTDSFIQKKFTEIITFCPWEIGISHFFKKKYELQNKHFTMFSKRSSPFYMFSWLQYLSKDFLEYEGGMEAFENNPLLKCERMHDGLLVQVGNSPYDAFTEEGEALLVAATNSLPPLVRKQLIPNKGKRTLIVD